MKITDIISGGKPTLSFEVFPPKSGDAFESVKAATEQIAAMKPTFMSVTCGASGSNSEYTVAIAENLKKTYGVTPIAHLTCVSASRSEIPAHLKRLEDAGIENILALRGDIPPEAAEKERDYTYASDLISDISGNGFCIGAACYPEGHVESARLTDDIKNLKLKVDAGAAFLTTQMFFDNDVLYSFLYKIREAGISVPVIAGVMPVTNAKQIKRICSLSGTVLPGRFRRLLDRFGDSPAAMQSAGIIYATEQIIDLYANGINAVHVYSMNKPEVAASIQRSLSEII